MISILAARAQEESRSASENQLWRIKKSYEKGIPVTGNCLGYRMVDHQFLIDEEEEQIVRKMTQEIQDKSSDDRIKSMNHFLASQLRLPESTSDIEVRIEFWKKFPFIVKSAIMFKVEDRLGLTEQSNEKLFPSGE